MAEIFPFRAYRYDPKRVDLPRVLTQPYDKITPAMQERYYALDRYNLITVEKGRKHAHDSQNDNVYTRAAEALNRWISERILVRDRAPSIYVYFQEYGVPHSEERRVRKGFIALGRVEDYEAGVVYRHEQTLAGPKADRLELLRHTQAHTGQLFMLYVDPKRRADRLLEEIARGEPPVSVRDEFEVIHKVWPVSDPGIVGELQREMADKKLVIADGHHRYETALAYRNEGRATRGAVDGDAPYEKVMMTFFNTRDEGLTILPTHRVVSNVKDFDLESFRRRVTSYFDWKDYPFSGQVDRQGQLEEFRRHLRERREEHAIGLYARLDTFHLLQLKRGADLGRLLPDISAAQRRLGVVLLHRLVLERGLDITADAVVAEKNIRYEREMSAAIAAVDNGQAQLCCLLNSVGVEQVAEIALAGEVLPQKSTDFYPKLLSGLTIYRLDAPHEG